MDITDLLHITRPLSRQGNYDGRIARLKIDSRAVRKNDVFIALRGSRSDGHHYISDAVRNGARVIIAERIPDNPDYGPKSTQDNQPAGVLYLRVADTHRIAGELAQAFAGYPARSMKMIGITGTNGKTTVSTLVYQVLKSLGYNTGLLGTVDTRIGDRVRPSRLTTPDPLTLAATLREMAEADIAFSVMEVSSHALDQKRVDGIRFDVAAFTNITQDHLDYHSDMASYVNAKKRLFAMLDAQSVAVINRNDPASREMTEGCYADIWEFGFRGDNDFRILDETPQGMVLDLDGTIVSTPLAGRYNAYNVAQAYLICLALGCTKGSVAVALSEATGAPGRLERVVAEPSSEISSLSATAPTDISPISSPSSVPTVFVDYAHTPDALENVLQALNKSRRDGETLHAVFGCGGDRDRAKRPEMGRIADQYADVVTLTSDNPRTEDPDAIIRDIRKGVARTNHLFVEPNRRKAIRSAILEADTRSVILIAGKGHETYQEVHGRRNKFDDREIAAKALTEWVSRRVSSKGRQGHNPEKEVF